MIYLLINSNPIFMKMLNFSKILLLLLILLEVKDKMSRSLDYGYRFGGIETIFKNQKSNGFYLEDIVNASLLYFENLYATLCITLSLLTCLGIEYSKNTKCYKNVKIQTHKRNKQHKLIRVLSVFKTGLILFKLATHSSIYIRLPLHFILYDM